MLHLLLKLSLLGAFCLLTGCGTPNAAHLRSGETETNLVSTQLITPALLLTPTVTEMTNSLPTPTVPAISELSLWFPEPLAPLNNSAATVLLAQHIDSFEITAISVTVDFRLKSVADVGGLMETLRAASAVAPSVLPDLTLLRRADLVAAVDAGLIAPISEGDNTGILSNYAPIVDALGRVEGVLYGLPYTVEVEHLVGQGVAPWMADFAALLNSDLPMVFPAGAPNTVSDVLLAQYREAAGTLNEVGLRIVYDPLRSVFASYEQAVSAGLIDPAVLDYTTPSDYAELILSGERAGVLPSTLYLALRQREGGAALTYAPIPTLSGAGTTVVDGWMWVITTRDAQSQAVALRFIRWLMQPERQAAYHALIATLPSQTAALNLWTDADYAAFVEGLLLQGTLPLVGNDTAIRARILSSAFASVIAGRQSADAAANEVQRQLP